MNPSPFLRCCTALATLSCAAAAQAQVQIYGTVDLALGQIETQPPGAPNAPIVKVKGVHSGGLQTSYFGFRGSEDLGGGLTARFQLEGFFRADTGVPGRFDATPAAGADQYWSRETFVGLGGAMGEVRLGVNGHPTWISMLQTNALGGNSVFSPIFRQLFNGGTRGRSEVDTALVNSIKYLSPNIGGVSASVALQAREGSGSKSTYSANLTYRSGPLLLSAATSSIGHTAIPNLPAARDQTINLVGGAYDFGVVRVFGQYTAVTNDRLRSKDKLPHFGLTVPFALGQLQFSSGQDTNTATTNTGSLVTKRKTTSLGYVHYLSKRTDLYAFIMADKLPVGTASSHVAGIRHQF